MRAALEHELDVAERKAWDALARYKFQMFGYWAAIWVHLNRIGDFKRPNPWHCVVAQAKALKPSNPEIRARSLDLPSQDECPASKLVGGERARSFLTRSNPT